MAPLLGYYTCNSTDYKLFHPQGVLKRAGPGLLRLGVLPRKLSFRAEDLNAVVAAFARPRVRQVVGERGGYALNRGGG